MFTGLIEETGTIARIEPSGGGKRFEVYAQKILSNMHIGDSIAVDGVCTTVVEMSSSQFAFEASPETLNRTTFEILQPKTLVNLERPVLPTTRLGGHFVSGHIDGKAKLVSRQEVGNSVEMQFELENQRLAPYMIEKGSVTLSGISLTVNEVDGALFSVAIIPHTLTHTNLANCQPGHWVNVETDMLGRYVEKLLGPSYATAPKKPVISEYPLALPIANPLNDLFDDEAVFIDSHGFLVTH